MINSVSTSHADSVTAELDDDLAEILRHLHHAAHWLPSQGPILAFVHHNTLHSLQHLSFFEALQQGQERYRFEPFLAESAYLEKLSTGRIRGSDIEQVLRDDLQERGKESIAGLGSRLEVRRTMACAALQSGPDAELEWLMAETSALTRFRHDVPDGVREEMVAATRHWVQRERLQSETAISSSSSWDALELDTLIQELSFGAAESALENWSHERWEAFCLTALWKICLAAVASLPAGVAAVSRPLRPVDILKRATGQDADRLVHEHLIRLTSAFLDQGLAQWELPGREQGMFRAFLQLSACAGGFPDRWLHGFAPVAADLLRCDVSPLESIRDSLAELGIDADQQEEFLTQTLLALPGWGGMIWQTETAPHLVVRPTPPGSLVEFVAVRLLLECQALRFLAKESRIRTGRLADLGTLPIPEEAEAPVRKRRQQAFYVFQLAQFLGWSPEALFRLSPEGWQELLKEIGEFNHFHRRRILHLAFERRYRLQALDALHVHSARPHRPQQPPWAQVVCCIDDREESFRRHLEEISPGLETFGAPGFFSVVMNYQGAAEAHAAPLCPANVRPRHWVREDVVLSLESSDRIRRKARQAVGQASRQLHLGSRTFAIGAVLTTVLGPLASLPMISRILFPRQTARVREAAGQLMSVPSVTQLQLERTESDPKNEEGHIGFTVSEMADIVERLLRDIGLTEGFAPLVALLGHGSSSQNNPHESAYNCGACAGSRGGPNARAFAQMANDPRIRDLLVERGIEIPQGTVFVGGMHNTCDDDVTFFNLDRLPASHRNSFLRLRQTVDQARERNALERCRRFESAPLSLTPEEALRHVETRSEDLAQVRPEYNHATNAMCIIGRRERTRGLFMDRRAFLQSYDPHSDDDSFFILLRIMQAAVPVCAGINLEYYFSTVDSIGWGCGNKLPHNVVSLLGVMEGAQSDLRTGLSNQMVEIHEPIRCLFVVEARREAIFSVMKQNAVIREHIVNGWIQLAILDPDSSRMELFVRGQFEPYQPESTELPQVASSYDWFRGWRDHLGFAAIRAVEATASPNVQAGRQESVR